MTLTKNEVFLMTLNDCCIKLIPFDSFPLSKDTILYEDNFWENILNQSSETSSTLNTLSEEHLGVSYFDNAEEEYNNSKYSNLIDGELNDQIDILSDKYVEQFEPRGYTSTKTILRNPTITSSKQSTLINDSNAIGRRLKSRKGTNIVTVRSRTRKTKATRNQISLFLRRQKRQRFPSKPSKNPVDVIRCGTFVGKTDERYKICPISRSNPSKSACFTRKCLCQAFVIRQSPLRKEIGRF